MEKPKKPSTPERGKPHRSGTSPTKRSAARWRRLVATRRRHNPARKARLATNPKEAIR